MASLTVVASCRWDV